MSKSKGNVQDKLCKRIKSKFLQTFKYNYHELCKKIDENQ